MTARGLRRFFIIGISTSVGFFAACTATRAGYDSAPYEVVSTQGSFEVRDYPEISLVSTAKEAAGDKDARFMRLFGYISGKNEESQKIDMTTPVFMSGGGETSEKGKMSFFVPTPEDKKQNPKPAEETVFLDKMPAARYATMKFPGTGKPDEEKQAVEKLAAWIKESGFKSKGDPAFAYYDPPWTPAGLRRNEVLIPIEKP